VKTTEEVETRVAAVEDAMVVALHTVLSTLGGDKHHLRRIAEDLRAQALSPLRGGDAEEDVRVMACQSALLRIAEALTRRSE
jgi:hypothetical protein